MTIEHAIADFSERIAQHFHRPESRRRAREYLTALLADVPRKNGSRLAGHARHHSSHGLQWLLGSAAWDANRVLDEVRGYLDQEFGSLNGVLVVGEVRFTKKGDKSAGVAFQRDAHTGRIENCQVGVFLAYTSERGRALIDRELFLPEEWAGDPVRRSGAAVPDGVAFRTKAALATTMIDRVRRTGPTFGWVVGGPEFGRDLALQEHCAAAHIGTVLQVPGDFEVRSAGAGVQTVAASALHLPKEAFQRRHYAADPAARSDWAALQLPPDELQHSLTLLIRREVADPSVHTYYLCRSARRATLAELIGLAELELTVAECADGARRHVGLGDYEVRKYVAWYRHMTMALVAEALLAVERSSYGWAGRGAAVHTEPIGGRWPLATSHRLTIRERS